MHNAADIAIDMLSAIIGKPQAQVDLHHLIERVALGTLVSQTLHAVGRAIGALRSERRDEISALQLASSASGKTALMLMKRSSASRWRRARSPRSKWEDRTWRGAPAIAGRAARRGGGSCSAFPTSHSPMYGDLGVRVERKCK